MNEISIVFIELFNSIEYNLLTQKYQNWMVQISSAGMFSRSRFRYTIWKVMKIVWVSILFEKKKKSKAAETETKSKKKKRGIEKDERTVKAHSNKYCIIVTIKTTRPSTYCLFCVAFFFFYSVLFSFRCTLFFFSLFRFVFLMNRSHEKMCVCASEVDGV